MSNLFSEHELLRAFRAKRGEAVAQAIHASGIPLATIARRRGTYVHHLRNLLAIPARISEDDAIAYLTVLGLEMRVTIEPASK